jgi:hypothetical protein
MFVKFQGTFWETHFWETHFCGSQTCFEKKPNIHLELSGTRRFFEVFSPTQTGGSF